MKCAIYRQWMVPLTAGLVLGAAIAGGIGVWRLRAAASREILIREGADMQLGMAVGQLGMIKAAGLSAAALFHRREALANVVATRALLDVGSGDRGWPLHKPLVAAAMLTIWTGPGSRSKHPMLLVSWFGLHEKVRSVVLYPAGYDVKQIVKFPADAHHWEPWPYKISKAWAFPVRLPSTAARPKPGATGLEGGGVLLDPGMLEKGAQVGLIYGNGRESNSVPLYIIHMPA